MIQSLLELIGLSRSKPDPSRIEIWRCNSLVVMQNEDLAFAGPATIEFESSAVPHLEGFAEVTDPEQGPQILIHLRQVDAAWPQEGRQDGMTLLCEDGNGNAVAWYLEGSATRMLREIRETGGLAD